MDRAAIFRQIVIDLNDDFYEKTDETEYYPLEYWDLGVCFGIKFMDIDIYNSENNSEYHDTEDRELTYDEVMSEVKKEVIVILSSLKKWELE